MKNSKDKPIAIAFADLHFNDWKDYPNYKNRIRIPEKALRKIFKASLALNVPILFAGDWFHNPKHLTQIVIDRCDTVMKRYSHVWDYRGTGLYGIVGNHDQLSQNYIDKPSINYLTSQPYIKLCDNSGYVVSNYNDKELVVYGIDYLTHNKGFLEIIKGIIKGLDKKAINILLIHRDLPTAQTSVGYEVKETVDLKDLSIFKPFTWVLSGHIHLPQRLADNVIMLGAPYQQDLGDYKIDMGYWLIYPDKVEFVNLKLPQFKYYKSDTPPNDKHIWIPKSSKKIDKLNITNELVKNNKLDKLGIINRYAKNNKYNEAKTKLLVEALKGEL